ncbi:ESPR-type extended signal peptide-containing protein [Burkholderia sola]|uniref:ESPR-type extended signal peptide-containing protein n=1 Tax=Burkholderia sola TaxID=2843302 RepID=A0ABV2C8S2_9BURK|nr:ESPR-type extended signal peptide-containing protein [Burkholderia sp. CpTa8-5]MBP0607566.1 YadA-like family protein [Burkholderia sp. CpTa8-5]
MNKTYRNIWNAATGTWTAVAETARSRSKGSARAARQAMVALALGTASIGGAFAADACTTEDNKQGTFDAAGVCRAGSAIGTMAGSLSYEAGSGASAAGANSVAVGVSANASDQSTTALGYSANASNHWAIAIGSTSAATGDGAIALGTVAAASGTNAVALGARSVADRDNSVSVGSSTLQRQIANVAAGTQGTDAVNLNQMQAAITAADNPRVIVGGTVDATATGRAGNIAIGSGANSAANALNSASIALGENANSTNAGSIAIGSTSSATGSESIAVGLRATATGTGAIVLGGDASATADNAVALGLRSVADRDNSVSIGSTGRERQLVNLAAGTQATDAVNVSQLTPVVSALGGGATIDPTTGAVTGPTYNLANGGADTTVGGALGKLDDALTAAKGDIRTNADNITTINNQLDGLSNGTVGLVQQAAAGADLTVGASTDGAAVNFAGTAGDRKLTGVAAGDVSATSNDVVNGSQLHGVADSVASAIGGGSTVNADGSISAPSFTVGDGSGGTTIVNSVGDAVTNLDGRVTSNEGKITDLADQLGSGTVGLVQQAAPGADITVGASTDGAAVNFAGTAGDRKLTGVAAGDVSATSNDVVNGSQLHGVADSVASAIGGGSTVNADGSISAPSFTVGDGSGGTTIVNSVGDVVTNLDGRVMSNEGKITDLADQLGSGTVGLVRQDAMSGMITVGAGGAGSVVNFAGSGGPRVLSGVANGVNDDDVVTISQLRATGLIDYTGKEVGAVTYDSGLSFDSVTFAGTDGTVLRQVAAGQISATSMEAVNGGQLYALQEQFAKQYGDLSGRFDDLSSRVGELETNPGDPGTGGPGAGGPGTGERSTVVGEGADASGRNSSAIGNGSVASGENSSAIGQGSVASGDNSSAVGQGSVASGEGSTALGQGASATGSNSVAIGQGSVATEANTVSFGDGTAEGNRRLVNIADGINASDAATKGQLDRAMESVDQRFNDTNRAINDVAKNAYAGIAAAMAMPNMTPSQPGKTVVAVGAANFKSGSAIAAGATYRSRNGNWLVNGATSVTSVGDVGIRAQVGYEF